MVGRPSTAIQLCPFLFALLGLAAPWHSGFEERAFLALGFEKVEEKGAVLPEDTLCVLHEEHLSKTRYTCLASRILPSLAEDDPRDVAMRMQDGDEQQEGMVYLLWGALLPDSLATLDQIQVFEEACEETGEKCKRPTSTLCSRVPTKGEEGRHTLVRNYSYYQAQDSSPPRGLRQWCAADSGGQDEGGSKVNSYTIYRRLCRASRGDQESTGQCLYTGNGRLFAAGNASGTPRFWAALDPYPPLQGGQVEKESCQLAATSKNHGCHLDSVSRSDFEEVCTSKGHILEAEDRKDPDDQGKESTAGHESAGIAAIGCENQFGHHRLDLRGSFSQRADAMGEGTGDGSRGPRRSAHGILAEEAKAYVPSQGREDGCLSLLAAILAALLMLGTAVGIYILGLLGRWTWWKISSALESAPRFRLQRVGCRRRSVRLVEKDDQGAPIRKTMIKQKCWGRFLIILILAGECHPVLTAQIEADELAGEDTSFMQGMRRWYGPSSLLGEDNAEVAVRMWPLSSQRYMNAQFVKWHKQLRRDGDLRVQLLQDVRVVKEYGTHFDYLVTDARRDGFDHTHARAEILLVETQHPYGWQFAPCLGDYYKNGFSWRAAALIPKPDTSITVLLLFDIFEETHECEETGQCRAIIGGEEFKIEDEIFEMPGHFIVLIESERPRDYVLSDASSTCSTATGTFDQYPEETRESTPQGLTQMHLAEDPLHDEDVGEEVVSLVQGTTNLHGSGPNADPAGIPADLLQSNSLWMTNTFTNRPAIRSVEIWHQLHDSVEGTVSTTQLRFETPRLNWQEAVRRIHESWHFDETYWTMKEVRDERLSIAKRAKALVVVSAHRHSHRRTGFVEVVNCLHDGIQTTTKVKNFDVSATYEDIYHALGLYSCIEQANCDVLVDGHDFMQLVYLPHSFTMQVVVQGGEVGQQMITPWVMLPFRHTTSFTAWRLKARQATDHLDFQLQTYHHWGNVYKTAEFEWQDLRARRWWMTEVHASVYNTPKFHEYDQVLVVSFNHAHQSQMTILSILEVTPLENHGNTVVTSVFHLPPSQTRESLWKTIATEIPCDSGEATCIVYRNGHELNYNEAMRMHHGDFVHITAILQETCHSSRRTIQLVERAMVEEEDQQAFLQMGKSRQDVPTDQQLLKSVGEKEQEEEDLSSLMNLGQLRRIYPLEILPEWLYIFILEQEEPLMLWVGNQMVTDWQRHVGEQVALRDPLAMGQDFLTRQVWYQPQDLTEKRAAAFVAAKFNDVRRKVPLLADLWWGQVPELALGDDQGFFLIWRRTKAADFRSTREDLIRHLGLEHICHEQGLQCQITWREMIWRMDDRTIHELVDGDYVRVTITDVLPQIPYQMQMQLLAEGCTLTDLQRQVNGAGTGSSQDQDAPAPHAHNGTEPDSHAFMQHPPQAHGGRYPWAYGYFRTVDEPIRTATLAAGDQPLGRFLAGLICARFDRDLAEELRSAPARPNPPDLEALHAMAFALAPKKDIAPWQVITLVDVHFESMHLAPGYLRPNGMTRKRSVRLVDYHVERDTLLLQVGVLHLCQLQHARCEITIRGQHISTKGDEPIRLEDGDYVVIDILPNTDQTEDDRQASQATCLGMPDVRLVTNDRGTASTPPRGPSPASNETIAYPAGDDVNMMQTTRPTRWFFLYTLGDTDPMAEELQGNELNDPLQAFQLLLLSRQAHLTLDLCYVHPVPQDLRATDTTPIIYWYEGLLLPYKVLLMVDVELYSNVVRPHRQDRRGPTPDDEWREISQVSPWITRSELIWELSLTHFCEGESKICILIHRDQVWTSQDAQKRTIQSCDYVVIKVRKEEDHAREAVQDCTSPRTSISQRTPSHGRSPDEGVLDLDAGSSPASSMSLLQRRVEKWRPTATWTSGTRLSPPGNGRVQFSSTIHSWDGIQETRHVDHAICNPYIAALTQEYAMGDCNTYMADFIQDIRRETLPTTPPRTREGDTRGLMADSEVAPLPLRLDEHLGHAYAWKSDFLPCHDEGIDFSHTIAAHEWFMKHQSLPSFDHSSIRWKATSRAWLGLTPSPPPMVGEWHVYVDGSMHGKGGGSACVIFFFDGWAWTYGGWLGFHSQDGGDSYQMEVRALLLAAKWTLDNLKSRPLGAQTGLQIIFHFDCAAAGLGALGQHGSRRNIPELHLVRACLQMLRTGYAVIPEGYHHHSHRGQPGNEMVDDVANACARNAQGDDDFWASALQTIGVGQSDWFWLLYRTDLLGKWKGGSLCLPKVQAYVDQEVIKDALPPTNSGGEKVRAEWNLQMATYNPMSLKGQGRRERDLSLLETTLGQFEGLGIHLVALQETRIRRKLSFSPHYHLLTAPADEMGNGGMLLGICKNSPIGQIQGKSVFFREDDLKLIHRDPNVLVAKLATPFWTLILVNVHCPHSGYDDQVLEAWWQKLDAIVTPHALHHEVIFLGDVNGKVGQYPSKAVGELAPDAETTNGNLFHQFMIRTGQWCPATFPHCHRGRTSTWISPTGHEHRIDFVALPLAWKTHAVASQGLDQVIARDFLHDHSATMVEVQASTWVTQLRPTKRYAPKRKIFDLEDAEKLRGIFHKLPHIAWEKDVHRHAQELHTHIKKGIDQGFEDRKKFALKSYIQQDTWALIQQKQQLRRQFFEMGRQSKLCLLHWAFSAWAQQSGDEDELSGEKDCRVHMAVNTYQFERLSRQVKYLMRRDENNFFEMLTTKILEADRPETQRLFWSRIRRLLPRFATRRQQLRSDKLVHLQGKWAPYLCELEAGEIVEFEELYSQCVERQNHQDIEGTSLAYIPSLRQIENRLRGVKADRCGGPDGVDPSWLARGCEAIAPAVFDLIFKSLLWRAEPIQFKGGRLTMLPKGGTLQDPSHFRGIMLASSISKCIHAHLREPLIQTLSPLRPPGQLGGFPPKSVLSRRNTFVVSHPSASI